MNTKPRVRAILGCVAVLGCISLPSNLTSSAQLRVISLLAPVERPLAAAGQQLGSFLDAILPPSTRRVRELEAEVIRLRDQLAKTQVELDRKQRELDSFSGISFRQQEADYLEASVIGEGDGAQRGLLFIDRGSSDGIRKGMIVIAGNTAVGRIRAVSPKASSVLATTARGFAIDAVVSSSSADPGILVGLGNGTMRLKYISKTQPQIGTQIVSRGRDGMTSGNLIFGSVSQSERTPGQLTYDIIIRPIRDVRRLGTVIVVRPKVTSADFPPGAGETDRER